MTSTCIFCLENIKHRIIEENETVFAVEDNYPVTYKHTLVIPKRHVRDYFEMSSKEKKDAERLILKIKNNILKEDESVKGFNIGLNCGEVAGQTVLHAHIHLIPRRAGDIEDPRGGVRGVIPDKRIYHPNK